MVKKQLTNDFQFGHFEPTVSVSLDPSGDTSQCWCYGTVWNISEITTRCWTFCRQHQLSRSNSAREIQRNVHVLVIYARGDFTICNIFMLLEPLSKTAKAGSSEILLVTIGCAWAKIG